MFNAEKTKNEIVEWIRDWFEENGKGCKAVIGLSGGKDSSVVAALCTEALGKDRVLGMENSLILMFHINWRSILVLKVS